MVTKKTHVVGLQGIGVIYKSPLEKVNKIIPINDNHVNGGYFYVIIFNNYSISADDFPFISSEPLS